ncbi:RloB family protein [Cytophagaceae bacterium DM2B3-1]|uniref:RloB family protein n=1 Tax=Xanthocytophaga flava TaxID=3048013 RepID=A0ABT7CXL0_9BACT|nr:RloB family protein [Xanthocytophaga flavus]MDJ1498401.1 RloB family protein [Xanthocytophaga flavus]
MRRQNRGYKRGEPFRDARIFVIICEGTKREPEYFRFFQQFTRRIQIRIAKPYKGSAPTHFLERAQKYDEETGIGDDDRLWFVSDVDRWKEETFRDIAHVCAEHQNWNLAISHPCFEVWLYMHFWDIRDCLAHSPEDYKQVLNEKITGGYYVATFAPHIKNAAAQARQTDTNPEHYMPERGRTKLYQLAEEMLDFMGQDWETIQKAVADLSVKRSKP